MRGEKVEKGLPPAMAAGNGRAASPFPTLRALLVACMEADRPQLEKRAQRLWPVLLAELERGGNKGRQ